MDKPLYRALLFVEYVNLGASTLLNIVLLYLVMRVSIREFGNYRHLLCAFALNDLYFVAIHALTLPIACTYGDAFVIFPSGVWSSQFSIAYYAATFTQTLPLLMHLFIYRYLVVKRPHLAPVYTRFNTALFIITTVGIEASIWCGGSYVLYEPDDISREYMKDFFKGYNYPDGAYLVSLYCDGDRPRLHRFAITLFFDVFLGSFIIVILFCAASIFRSLKDNSKTWSIKTRKLQKRLFEILNNHVMFVDDL